MSYRRRLSGVRGNLLRRLRDSSSPAGATGPADAAGKAEPSAQRSFRLLDQYSSLIRSKKSLNVVLMVADGARDDEVAQFLAYFGKDHVHVIASDTQPEWELARTGAKFLSAERLWQANWQIKKIGPLDVVVHLAAPEQDLVRVWETIFFHLRHRGHYIVRQPPATSNASWISLLKRVSELGQAYATDTVEAVSSQDRELARAISRVISGRDLMIVGKRGHHYLKLRDLEADRLLPTRASSISTELIATLPKGELTSGAVVSSYGNLLPQNGFSDVMAYPPMRVRHYTGRITMATHSLLYADAEILPESFRYHLEKNLKNTRLTDSAAEFARISHDLRAAESLSGNFYHLDSPFTGHFGHIMTEVVSRLWGWEIAKARVPDLKAIFRTRFANDRVPELESQIFEAYGIARKDIVWVDHPVQLSSVVGVTPMWHNQVPHYVHPKIRETWDRIGTALADPPKQSQSRIFVSRTAGLSNRRCRNATAVEEYFVQKGFSIVYPENLSIRQQAGVFAQAEVVAGFAGSAMFNVMFSKKLRSLILLTHESYTARNEYLFSSVLGSEINYFWSTPDLHHPRDGWSLKAFTSDWEFEFERHREDLDKLLDRLSD